MMKRRLCITALVFTFFLLFSFSAYADSSQGIGATSGTCGSKLTWTLSDNGVLTISGTGAMSNYNTTAGTPWETRKASIVSVVVNSGVTSIGDCAFYSCVNLSSVDLPSGLKTIGVNTFRDCDALVSISLPNGLTSIGESSFYGCDKLKTVTLPSTLTSIGESAFYYCGALTNITLPSNLSNIQGSAFSRTNLKTIVLPDSVVQMGTSVFEGCSNLSSVIWSNSITSIPAATFDGYYSSGNRLSEVAIPEGVTQIDNGAFRSCFQLTTVSLPVSLESINASAFANCSNLPDIYYAGTQTQAEAIQIGTNNTYLTSASWHYETSEAGPEEPDHSCGDNLVWSLSNSGVLTISGSGAMFDFSNANDAPWSANKIAVTTVNVENGVISIGSNAFNTCENLLVVNLPSTTTSIGANAFNACSKLTVANYAGTSVQKAAISIGSNNDALMNADWYCTDGDSHGIGATSGTCGSKLTWALSNDGTLTISGTGAMNNYTSSSGTPWEARKSSIKTAVVGNGVTSIGV